MKGEEMKEWIELKVKWGMNELVMWIDECEFEWNAGMSNEIWLWFVWLNCWILNWLLVMWFWIGLWIEWLYELNLNCVICLWFVWLNCEIVNWSWIIVCMNELIVDSWFVLNWE